MNQTQSFTDTTNAGEPHRSVLKWHVTKWVPQFRIEEGDIKMDLSIFYIFIVFLILGFLFILRTVLFTGLCYTKVTKPYTKYFKQIFTDFDFFSIQQLRTNKMMVK